MNVFEQTVYWNRVRFAWVSQMPETDKRRLQAIVQQARFEIYAQFDREVHKEWIEMMREYHRNAIAQGAKTLKGTQILEQAWQIDTNDILLQAAAKVLARNA